MLLRFSLLSLVSIFSFPSFAQIPNIAGIINHYTAVQAIDSCNGRLTVNDTTGLRPGNPVLLIQMQGAEILEPNNALYGAISAMNAAGRYERAMIDSVAPGAVYLQSRPVYVYAPAAKVQLVTLPQYINAVVTDTLRAMPWNGSSGGIIALEVSGTLTLNAPISADGAGFRGGASVPVADNNCNFLVPQIGYFFAPGDWRGATKGEGIAIVDSDKVLGRGPQANGGGGGNDHNSGGGGGGNTTDGGDGGDNDEPGFLNCDGYWPGLGGNNIPAVQSRLFLGGGGGAGHGNGTTIGFGGRGGGMIYAKAGVINGTSPTVTASGWNGGTPIGDGGGGGGAGGTIWLDCPAPPSGMGIHADGGSGGNTDNFNQNRCFGPGGGGGGGRVLTNISGITVPAGGPPGLITNSTNGCNGSSSSAQTGEAGEVVPLPILPQGSEDFDIPQIVASPQPQTVCEGEDVVFIVQTNAGNWTYQWQVNVGSGWSNIANTPPYTTTTDTLLVDNATITLNGNLYRCLVERAGCYATTSGEAILSVEPSPNAAFNAFLNGTVLDVINFSTNATAYFWDFGDGTSSTLVMPQHNYGAESAYTLTLYAINGCDTSVAVQTVTTLLLPEALFAVQQDAVHCGSAQVSFLNGSVGTGLFYNWLFPGGSPSASAGANPVVTYANSGVYSAILVASNAAGSDTSTMQVVVNVVDSLAGAFTYTDLTGGVFQFSNLSLSSADWLWDFGDGTLSAEFDPLHQYFFEGDYVVTLLVWNVCDTLQIQQMVTWLAPPQAGMVVADTVYACQTAQVFLNNTSTGSGLQYQWFFPGGTPGSSVQTNPLVTYPATGDYQATLIASNSNAADTLVRSFNIQVLDFPMADFSASTPVNGLVQFQNLSQQATYYTWDFGDGSGNVYTIDAAHVYTQSGMFVVTLVAANPCGASVFQQNIDVPMGGVGTNTPMRLQNVLFYPNPSHGMVHVDASQTGDRLMLWRLYGADGRLVLEQNVDAVAPQFTINIGQMPSGAFFLELFFENGRVGRRLLRL